MTSTCAALASTSTSISGPFSTLANSTSRVTRDGTDLLLDGESFRPVGPNIYWLGLAQDPSISYPTYGQVEEILATATVMGANAVRAHTLGVSYGCDKCLMPSLDKYNSQAFEHIDYALYAARSYGVKLVVPLTDQWDYYHGGIATFLRWRDKDPNNHSPFYDLDSQVYNDWMSYVETLLNHTSPYTGLAMKDDPTIMAFETGNELKDPPIEWTTQVSKRLKQLSDALVVDGQYGVNKAVASVDSVDIVSDHFYPLMDRKLHSDVNKARSIGKAYIAGEYDWTDRYSRLPLLAGLIPVVLAMLCFLLPRKWFGKIIYLPCLARLPCKGKRKNRPTPYFITKKWHLALCFLLLVPIIEGIIVALGPSKLQDFLPAVEKSSANGDFYWSLFGRDSDCCQFISHNDGYTLHYDSTNKNMQNRALKLMKHAYAMSGRSMSFLAQGESLNSHLPGVSCPQDTLNVPNATTTGTTTSSAGASATSSAS